ncbi:tetratricopeptide repeat protein [Acetonema longum]|uniref:Uncharacterized protein n=1 Tax=Acetonema longum DSM 6540 TaxID=1009370 RepID=F7NJH8_9FIRM|nr:tetratricopeptide repeat protein [Acetonema longum]EGO63808.1 hypothetical protein ALO_11169 [Acetonema longum DSM 6540]
MMIIPNKKFLIIVLGVSIVFNLLGVGAPVYAISLSGEELSVQGADKNDVLSVKISQLMQRELSIADLDEEWYNMKRMMKIRLPNMPVWVDQQVLVAHGGALFLIGADEKLERVELLARTKDEVYINLAKFAAYCNDAKITVWSQQPYRSFQLTAVVEWDGSGLNVISAKYSDPSQEYYDKMAALLQAGRLEEAMANKAYPFYPQQYGGYYKVPQLALLKAHEYALDKYRAGDATFAAKVLKWGLDQYLEVQVGRPLMADKLDGLKKLNEPGNSRAKDYRVDLNEFISALNDYAFFLAEIGQNSEAESYLEKVAEMAPDRLVVYINLGDVCWKLGKYKEAREYYRRYLGLLGDVKAAPQRVLDRTNGE